MNRSFFEVAALAAFMFSLTACEDLLAPVADEEQPGAEALLGTWLRERVQNAVVMTTGSDQVLLNFFEAADGELTVTGEKENSLTYVLPSEHLHSFGGNSDEHDGEEMEREDDVVPTVVAIDTEPLTFLKGMEGRLSTPQTIQMFGIFPRMIVDDQTTDSTALVSFFMEAVLLPWSDSGGDYDPFDSASIYINMIPELTFDEESYSLSTNSLMLYLADVETDSGPVIPDSSKTVTISGQLAPKQFSVPAGTPTVIPFPIMADFDEGDEERGPEQVTFAEDSVMTGVEKFTYSRWDEALGQMVTETSIDTFTGKWFATDSTITIFEEWTDGRTGETMMDTLMLSYYFSDGSLIVMDEEDWCEWESEDEEQFTYAECLSETEQDLLLDKGSLTSLMYTMTFTFEPSTAGTTLARSMSSPQERKVRETGLKWTSGKANTLPLGKLAQEIYR